MFVLTHATLSTRLRRVRPTSSKKYRTSVGEPDGLDDVHRDLSLRPPEDHSGGGESMLFGRVYASNRSE